MALSLTMALASQVVWHIQASPPAVLNTPRYSVDLDVPATHRWASVLDDFLDAHGTDDFEATYNEWLDWLAQEASLFGPDTVNDTANRFLQALETHRPDFHQELLSLSAALQLRKPNVAGFQAPLLALAASGYIIGNIFPENSDTPNSTHIQPRSACTSTLVAGSGGRVLHGRSLDYEPRTAMAKTTVEVQFTRGGEVQYTCLHPLVYPTALQWITCQRPGQMSLSVNARSRGRWMETNITFQELLRRIAVPGNMLLGEVAVAAMDASTYLGALDVLTSAPVVSSNYFVLAGAGPNQGALVTRFGNHSTSDVWAIGSGASDGQTSWMRAQTNVDHWVSYKSGEYATHRRQHVIELLRSIETPVLEQDLWRVYEADTALDEASLQRKDPEDTGAILRPTTIASLVMSPAVANNTLDVRIWARDPTIQPPVSILGIFV